MQIFWTSIYVISSILASRTMVIAERGDEFNNLDHDNSPIAAIALEHPFVKTTGLKIGSSIVAPSSPSPFSQMLVNIIVDTKALCVSKGQWDRDNVWWEYRLRYAECYPQGGSNRIIRIICDARSIVYSPVMQVRNRRAKTFMFNCPEHTVCQPIRNNPGEGPPDELACVDEPEVTVQPVVLNEREPEEFCALTLALPGSQYRARPGVTFVDLILTEQVLFPNGSAYRSPKLFIRDTTTKRVGVNRALRVDASVNSAQVRLTSIGGKLQTKTFEFCMQRLPGIAGRSFTLVYSWFQISSNLRHGRVPALEEMRNTTTTTEA